MNYLDGLLRGLAGRHQLAAAGKPQHQVLLHKAERDVQIGGHEALVNINRGPASRRAQRAMRRKVACVVARHAIFVRNLRPQNYVELIFCRRAMKASGNQNRDSLDGDARLMKPLEKRRQRDAVGHRARDVTNGDGRGLLACG